MGNFGQQLPLCTFTCAQTAEKKTAILTHMTQEPEKIKETKALKDGVYTEQQQQTKTQKEPSRDPGHRILVSEGRFKRLQ